MDFNIETLNKIRKEKRISYDELARITGYSRSTITNIFCGYVKFPRHETMQDIYNALGVANLPPLKKTLIASRLNAGITQKKMADKIGVTVEQYADMESSILGIKSNHLQKICDVLGVSLDALFGKPVAEIENITKTQMEMEKTLAIDFINFILSDADTGERHHYYEDLPEEHKEIFVSFLLHTREDLTDFRDVLLTVDSDVDIMYAYQNRANLWEAMNNERQRTDHS